MVFSGCRNNLWHAFFSFFADRNYAKQFSHLISMELSTWTFFCIWSPNPVYIRKCLILFYKSSTSSLLWVSLCSEKRFCVSPGRIILPVRINCTSKRTVLIWAYIYSRVFSTILMLGYDFFSHSYVTYMQATACKCSLDQAK